MTAIDEANYDDDGDSDDDDSSFQYNNHNSNNNIGLATTANVINRFGAAKSLMKSLAYVSSLELIAFINIVLANLFCQSVLLCVALREPLCQTLHYQSDDENLSFKDDSNARSGRGHTEDMTNGSS